MARLWAWRVTNGINTLEEVPERWLPAVKKELGIEQFLGKLVKIGILTNFEGKNPSKIKGFILPFFEFQRE